MNATQRSATLIGLVCVLAVLPALAGTTIERELVLAPGGRLVVDAEGGSVTVRGTSGSSARVLVTSRRDDLEERYTLRFEERAGEVAISAERKSRSWLGWNSNGSLHFDVEVPERTELIVDTSGGAIEIETITGDVNLDTSGGGIRVADVRGRVVADTSGGAIAVSRVDGDVNADTSGGGIDVHQVRGNVRADTSGGPIRIRDVDGDVDAETSGGSIRVTGAGGRVTAETSGGPVQVVFAPGNSRGGTLSSSGGGVDVTVGSGVGLELDAVSSGGSVSSDLPVSGGEQSRTSLRGRIGAGGPLLKLRTSGGSIRVREL